MNKSNDLEWRNWYSRLSDSDKLIFLALISCDLTIHGRAFGLDLSGEQQVGAFKGLNELQHLISSHVAAIAMKRERYPEDVFIEILFEKASLFGLATHLRQSLNHARTREHWKELN